MDRSSSLELDAGGDFPPEEEVSCNLVNVHTCLTSGLVQDDDVDLKQYLIAYQELYNFFLLLGKAFSFVASDVKTKIEILDNFLKGNNGSSFVTVKKMMNYEIDGKLLADSKYVSGSRTLLRLHRGLDFVRKFLREIHNLDDSQKIGEYCKKAYDSSLANYHPWMIRTAVSIAVKLLPNKKTIVDKITKGDPDVAKQTEAVMPDMLKIMDTVYQRVEDLYTKYKLHELK